MKRLNRLHLALVTLMALVTVSALCVNAYAEDELETPEITAADTAAADEAVLESEETENQLPETVTVEAAATKEQSEAPPADDEAPPLDEAVETAAVESAPKGIELVWEADYGLAMQQAERQKRMLLIHFYDEKHPKASEGFLSETDKSAVREKLSHFMLARLPIDAEVSVGGSTSKLLDHKAFAELEHRQGIVVIDFANEEAKQYGLVVSTLPFHSGKYYHFDPHHVAVILDLPPGTETQRAMVFAVRIHPEGPQSTKGNLDSNLLDEARQHSQHQAQIQVQGHHNWDHRFSRIHGVLHPFGLVPQEVVAESWPHESLLDAAVDCVHSWRQSPGHWGAVKRDQPRFGYDMRRGSNGIWYATGIFGNRH